MRSRSPVIVLAAMMGLAIGAPAMAAERNEQTEPTTSTPGPRFERDAADEEGLATGAFGFAGELAEARYAHTATLLPDGRVLVIAGEGVVLVDPGDHPWEATYEAPRSAEVWDPISATFGAAGSVTHGREGHSATLLPDGRVLVIGGWDPRSRRMKLAELWDPVTESFRTVGRMARARQGHTATLLSDGRVLVLGGWRSHPEPKVGMAEVWDPLTETFSPAGALVTARAKHTATSLPDGRVLVVGGVGNREVAGAEVWDPTTETSSPAGDLVHARSDHTATLLPDGRVLVVGGHGGRRGALRTAEVWDPSTESFDATGSLRDGRWAHTATLLPDGRVLVVGGSGDGAYLGSAETWDPRATSHAPWPSSTDATAEQVRRDLVASLPVDLDCRDYVASEVPNDPFAYGAIGAVSCTPAPTSPFGEGIEHATLFRFPDRESMYEYWSFRRKQNPKMRNRGDACADGKRGYGKWAHGRFFCYVSKSGGHALLRWSDERTNTYGVLDHQDAWLDELYLAWLEVRP